MATPSNSRSGKARSEREDLRQVLADKLIEQIEAGTAHWQRPWVAGEVLPPVNAVTGKPYRGVNRENLMMFSPDMTDNRWCTYKQAQEQGWQVRKGEKGTLLEVWKEYDHKRTPEEMDAIRAGREKMPQESRAQFGEIPETEKRLGVKYYSVFHASQIDGIPPLERPDINHEIEGKPDERLPKLAEAMGVNLQYGGGKAFYRPSADRVQMPPVETFEKAVGHDTTLLHELSHATGHGSRLNRDLTGSFGTESYAIEELRAEMSAVWTAASLGIGFDPAAQDREEGREVGNSAAYLASWLKALPEKERKQTIMKAIKDAQGISDYLIERTPEIEIAEPAREIEAGKDLETLRQKFQAVNDIGVGDRILRNIGSGFGHYDPEGYLTRTGGSIFEMKASPNGSAHILQVSPENAAPVREFFESALAVDPSGDVGNAMKQAGILVPERKLYRFLHWSNDQDSPDKREYIASHGKEFAALTAEFEKELQEHGEMYQRLLDLPDLPKSKKEMDDILAAAMAERDVTPEIMQETKVEKATALSRGDYVQYVDETGEKREALILGSVDNGLPDMYRTRPILRLHREDGSDRLLLGGDDQYPAFPIPENRIDHHIPIALSPDAIDAVDPVTESYLRNMSSELSNARDEEVLQAVEQALRNNSRGIAGQLEQPENVAPNLDLDLVAVLEKTERIRNGDRSGLPSGLTANRDLSVEYFLSNITERDPQRAEQWAAELRGNPHEYAERVDLEADNIRVVATQLEQGVKRMDAPEVGDLVRFEPNEPDDLRSMPFSGRIIAKLDTNAGDYRYHLQAETGPDKGIEARVYGLDGTFRRIDMEQAFGFDRNSPERLATEREDRANRLLESADQALSVSIEQMEQMRSLVDDKAFDQALENAQSALELPASVGSLSEKAVALNDVSVEMEQALPLFHDNDGGIHGAIAQANSVLSEYENIRHDLPQKEPEKTQEVQAPSVPETENSESVRVVFWAKVNDAEDIANLGLEGAEKPDVVRVQKSLSLSPGDYDRLTNGFLVDDSRLAGLGGHDEEGNRLTVQVDAPDRQRLFIDPQGYDYARYVGVPEGDVERVLTTHSFDLRQERVLGPKEQAIFDYSRFHQKLPENVDRFIERIDQRFDALDPTSSDGFAKAMFDTMAESDKVFGIITKGEDRGAFKPQLDLQKAGVDQDKQHDLAMYWWQVSSDESNRYKTALESARERVTDRLKTHGKEVLRSPGPRSAKETVMASYWKHGLLVDENASTVNKMIEAVEKKDLKTLVSWIGANSQNPGSEEAFSQMTGVTLGKTQKERLQQLADWVGPEKVAAYKAERKATAERRALKAAHDGLYDSYEALNRVNVSVGVASGDPRTRIINGKDYVTVKMSEGLDHIVTKKRGAVNAYYLRSEDGVYSGLKDSAFTDFCKAALVMEPSGDLPKAMRAVEFPVPDRGLSDFLRERDQVLRGTHPQYEDNGRDPAVNAETFVRETIAKDPVRARAWSEELQAQPQMYTLIAGDDPWVGGVKADIPGLVKTMDSAIAEKVEMASQPKTPEQDKGNAYEAKQRARKDRMLARAAKIREEAKAKIGQASKMSDVIPFGQPILVDHYSAGRDRRYRKRIGDLMDKGTLMLRQADAMESRAKNENTVISADDPNALEKLKEKLASLQKSQEMMKAANAMLRKESDPEKRLQNLQELGFTQKQATEVLHPYHPYGAGFAGFELRNNNASIKRIEDRVKGLEKAQTLEDRTTEYAWGSVRENKENNRIQFLFDGKPEKEVIDLMKQTGFRWAPSEKAWQRQWTGNAVSAARRTIQQLNEMQPQMKKEAEQKASPYRAPVRQKSAGIEL
ncbi:zincin-like metallopeptidase domain-containing protein [Acidithiobacillus montserratensis]|uniref:Zincin-like metallopeptidase domain-containing protein n=1 Tax=Acidithiobacillus montserratensis TaxID=2729135 RepID=A0ACD5HI51_9PROT|nr:zincin-like metallopeptidase domain-containing protein [Acidithiobacillus montserratensis]MBU2747841.1 DUF1738 domain-containing protein [Acidithiobacillus montserratensis]